MNISALFIRRPVGTTLLALGLTLCGVLAFMQLPVSALPEVDFPTIVVSTLLPGASSETMVTTVTTPLERQLGQMPSVRQMTSVSSFGASQVTIQFDLERPIDSAEQDVQAALNAAATLLPKTLPTPPTYSKSNPADAPILTLAVRSHTLPINQVHDYADSVLAQKVSQQSGVGLVTLAGSQKPAVRVRANPEVLATMGLALEDLRTAIVAANVNAPKGTLEGHRQAWSLSTDDQLLEAAQYKSLVIAYRNGAPVRLASVADVEDGAENTQVAGWADGERAILLNVQRQPGANILRVAEGVHRLVEQLRPSMPAGMSIEVMADRTVTTRASVEDVEMTLLLTILLVVAVIYLFLQDGTATLIPAVCVPLSILGTFCLMYLGNMSLDNLSLMALTISTGFVVDDAIVMIENIARLREQGLGPLEAALEGAKQISFTIISLTISLIAVLIPLLFMGGTIGRLFFAFSIVLTAAIVTSALLSLTLTPMMSARLLRHEPLAQKNFVVRGFEHGFEASRQFYGRTLVHVLRWPRTTLLVVVGTVALTGVIAWHIPKGFFPEADTGALLGISEAASDISFAHMAERQQALAHALQQDEEVEHIASFIGSDGTNPTLNVGRLSITLVPHAARKSSLQAVTARLSERAQDVEGIALYLQPIADLQLDARQGRTQYQYTLQAASAHELDTWVPKLAAALSARPELRDVASDQAALGQTAHLTLDRDAAARLGVTPQMVDDTLYDAYGQRFVSTIFTQLNQYRVILEVPSAMARVPSDLLRLRLPVTLGNEPIMLANVASVSVGQAPLSISHQGQFPAATLSFNLARDVSLGSATAAIRSAEQQVQLPSHLRAEFAGTAQAFGEALGKEPPLIVAALLVVYIVLGVLYESAIHPLTILSTLPSAGVGALLALWMCGLDFNIMALIGIVLLIGIVKKNAIMMIDFALEAQRGGKAPHEAIYEASLLRFRPIMMTTLAALLGALPLALGQGPGSELRRPLGIAIVGGLLLSQVLTLYTTPVIYLTMHRMGELLGRLRSRGHHG